jgi:hypothetical protein
MRLGSLLVVLADGLSGPDDVFSTTFSKGTMMMKRRTAITLALTVLLPACTDSIRNAHLTAPLRAPSFELTESDPVAPVSSIVGTSRAATGARASGHAEVFSAFFGAAYKYSFIVLATPPTPTDPTAAKGELQATILQTVGSTAVTDVIHADIDCAAFFDIPIPNFGRMANASGPIKSWTRDGEPVPFAPGQEVLFTAQDNGEGQDSSPDRASAVVPIGGGRHTCRSLFLLMQNSEPGNIQVVFPGERGNNQP